ncbi:MAG: hypothetical protein NVS4B12_15050 [Ktedonobacteraceae bacterium]
MQTQNKQAAQTPSSVQKSRRVPWLSGLGVFAGVALLVGFGATTFAYWHAVQNSTAAHQVGTWQRVLDGYNIMSLTAAPNNAAVLYACGVPVQSPTSVSYGPGEPVTSYTLLRSADDGAHWQEVTRLIADCQIAVNPINSNDIYAVALAGHVVSNGQAPTVLKHSTDGGRSWTDIAPTLDTGNAQLSVEWHIRQLSVVGSHLFGIQMVPGRRVPPIVKPTSIAVVARLDASRLVESSDGGYTWRILDGNLPTTEQGTSDYAVSPSNPQTIYALVGLQWFPYHIPVTPKDVPTFRNTLTLYKTTNDGGTWTKLLENVGYGGKIQLASNNAALLYVGGPTGVMPLTEYDVEPGVASVPGYFWLRVSKDSGATWNTVKLPTERTLVQDWFGSPDGHLYMATSTVPSGQPTGTIGTFVPVGGTETIRVTGGNVVTRNQGVVEDGVTAIQRYDATSGMWSTIPKTPSSGRLLAVTASTTLHRDALWFLGDAHGKAMLYREMV